MASSKAEQTIYSPQSSASGIYENTFTAEELSELRELAAKILNENEWIAPLIPELVIRQSVEWYAQLFIGNLLKQINPKGDEITLEEFKNVAENYLVIYNLNGAKWFKEAFELACLEELKSHFENINVLSDANLKISSVHVTSSSGKKTFNKAAQFKVWDEKIINGKHVISLDDIGDRGTTQETIRERLLTDGALSTTTVNLVEKIVPDDIDEEHQKKHSPDIALLQAAYHFLLGWGLDDGKREETRNFKTIAILDSKPADDNISFQGGLS